MCGGLELSRRMGGVGGGTSVDSGCPKPPCECSLLYAANTHARSRANIHTHTKSNTPPSCQYSLLDAAEKMYRPVSCLLVRSVAFAATYLYLRQCLCLPACLSAWLCQPFTLSINRARSASPFVLTERQSTEGSLGQSGPMPAQWSPRPPARFSCKGIRRVAAKGFRYG